MNKHTYIDTNKQTYTQTHMNKHTHKQTYITNTNTLPAILVDHPQHLPVTDPHLFCYMIFNSA